MSIASLDGDDEGAIGELFNGMDGARAAVPRINELSGFTPGFSDEERRVKTIFIKDIDVVVLIFEGGVSCFTLADDIELSRIDADVIIFVEILLELFFYLRQRKNFVAVLKTTIGIENIFIPVFFLFKA